MTKMKRLMRSELYTTGDDQEWTYEYTWEDLQEALKRRFYATDAIVLTGTLMVIINYFKEYPEKALIDGYYKNKGYTDNGILNMINRGMDY